MTPATDRTPWVLASLLGAVAAGLVLVVHAVVTGDGALDVPAAGDTAAAILFLFGTTWAVALTWGLAVGVVTGAVHATLHGWWQGFRARLADPERDASTAAGLLAAALAAAVWMVLFVRLYASRDEEFLIKLGTASRFFAVGAAALLAVAVAAWFPVHRLLRRALVWRIDRLRSAAWPLTRRLTVAALACAALAVAAAVWLMESNEELANVRRLPLYLLTLALLHGVATAALRRLHLRHGWALLGAPVIVVILTVLGIDRVPAAHEAAETRSDVQAMLLRLLRGPLDLDGDGYAALLGGGDCDDWDAAVGPHAGEVAGNGVDDDCQDGDADPTAAAAWEADPSLLAEDEPPSAPVDTPRPIHGTDAPAAPATADAPAGPGTVEAPTPRPDAPPPLPRKGLNVLFIVVDTLRADHVGFYGYERDTTPAIDALARQSVVFRYAYAQANNTPRSMPSLLTSRFPSAIRWVRLDRNYPQLKDAEHTVGESLADGGYRVEAETSHYYFVPKRRLDQGFHEWSNPGAGTIAEANEAVTAPKLLPRAMARLEKLSQREEPWFLFVHFFEPHASYIPHKPPADFGRTLKDRYDGEIRFTDDHVGQLLAKLDALGHREDTLVILTSDHGEAFREKGYFFHGHSVYNVELRVPLVMRLPGVDPRVIDERVALLDVVPTMLSAIGLPIAPTMQGVDLVPTILHGERRGLPIYAELLPYPNWPEDQRALILGHHKVLYTKKGNVWELYDIQADPFEKENLFRTHSKAQTYKKALLDWMALHAHPKAMRGP